MEKGPVELKTKISPELYEKVLKWCSQNEIPYTSYFLRQAIEEKLSKRRGRPKKK